MSSAEEESQALANAGDYHGTHRPILLSLIWRAEGPVLEIGAGHSSTAALHAACFGVKQRHLVTIENNKEWLDKFTDLTSPSHEFVLGEAHEALLTSLTNKVGGRWGIVFVDNAPAAARKPAIEALADKADFIVVHDSEDEAYGFEATLASFKYRRDWKIVAGPWTTVVSNTHEVPELG